MRAHWRKLLAGLPILLLVLAAASPPAGAKEEMKRIREKAEELARKEREAWFNTLGMGKKAGIERAHKDYAYLLGKKKIEEVEQLVEQAEDPEERKLRNLTVQFLQDRTIWLQVAPTLDNYLEFMRKGSILAGDVTVLLTRFHNQLSETPEQSQRRLIYLAAQSQITNANVFLLNMEIDLDRYAQELGLENYYDFLAAYQGWDPSLMDSLATRLLAETREEYRLLLEKEVQRALNQQLRRVRMFDMPYVMAGHRFDDLFPAKKIEEVGRKAAEGIGVPWKNQRYLRVDLKDREGKVPEAHCFPVANGRNTWITMIPEGGVDDYREYLGALGEAEFYYHIDEELPFEYRYLGAPVLPMVFGDLFAGLLEKPDWLAKHVRSLDEERLADLQEFLRLSRLYELRRAAAHYLFQRRLHQDPKTPPSAYTEIMEEALLVTQTRNEEPFYLSANDRFRSGGRLLAAVLAAELSQYLKDQAGADWYLNKKGWAVLRAIASEGFARSPMEWSAEWGYPELEPALLRAELNGES
jgi:hypothetical protein